MPLMSFRRAFLCLMLPLLLCITGCKGLWSPSQLSDVPLNIRVAPLGLGLYGISGETSLPQGTQLTVVAVRYLTIDASVDADAAQFNPTPTYSILAYQPVKVAKGKWQTQLNLWQVAADGRYQESWQLEQARLGLALKPSENIVFLATLTPVDNLSALERQLAGLGQRLASGAVRSTPEGQRYAQVNQSLALALPTGSTTPPGPQANEVNYGWGDRYLIPQEPQNPYDLEFPRERQTNAPPLPGEFLR